MVIVTVSLSFAGRASPAPIEKASVAAMAIDPASTRAELAVVTCLGNGTPAKRSSDKLPMLPG